MMKTIELKKLTEKIVANGKTHDLEISTIELLKTAINNPVQGGYTASDMLTRIKLLDKVEKAETEEATKIDFEDNQFTALAKIAQDTKWSIVSRFIGEFLESFDQK